MKFTKEEFEFLKKFTLSQNIPSSKHSEYYYTFTIHINVFTYTIISLSLLIFTWMLVNLRKLNVENPNENLSKNNDIYSHFCYCCYSYVSSTSM
jgi:hypothetical protein